MKKGPLLNNNSRKFTTRDSLGIERVAASISRDLCPIVNTVTPRAFYWAFMVWIYYDFYKYSGIEEHSVDVFDKVYLKRQDYFFVLSQLLTQGSDQSNLVGKQNSQEDINKNPDGPYVFNAAYFVSRYGGMQYYNAGCLTMDYIRDFEKNMRFPFPKLTAEGRNMALEFQSIIKNTEYYKHYRLNDVSVPKDVLIEYGKAINIGLNGFEGCKESLRKHLFENPANHMLKCSADYVKFIYDHCDMSNADLSSYRDILFDAFSVKGRNKTLPPELREVANGWEIVVGRQYFTSGLEAIWKYMLEQIKLPLTKKEWIKYCIDNTDWDINIDNPVSTFLPKCNYDFKIREAMISDERHNEVFNVIDYTEKDKDYQDIIVAAINSFIAMNKISYFLDGDLIKEITDFVYYRKCQINGERYLLTSCEDSILEQVMGKIEKLVTSIKIAVPYYDNKAAALKDLQMMFPDTEIKLYVQQGTSTIPKEYIDKHEISIFDMFTDTASAGKGNFYHGKVFLFKTEDKDYILYGSANCTVSALEKTHTDGGNVEADILDSGLPGEFDQFFDNMHVIKGAELSSKKLTYEPVGYFPIRFVSAEMVKEGIECVLALSGHEDSIELSYGDKVFNHTVKDGRILLQIEKDVVETMPMIFDLSARCSSGDYSVRCWVIDRFTLGTNRNDSSDMNLLVDFDINADGDKFRNDRFNLLKAEIMCIEELQEYRKIKAYLNQQQIMDEEVDESDADEDFVVDSELQYEYRSAYKKYDYVEKVRNLFLHRFLNPIVFHEDKENESAHGENKKDDEQTITKPRKPTTEEKRFERFVKRRLKGILNPDFVNSVSAEHYLGISRVIVEIFDKYRNVAMFDVEYVIYTKLQLIMSLLNKDISQNEDESNFEEHIVVWALCIILQNRELIKLRSDDSNLKLISADRELLGYLDDKFDIREHLDALILKAADKTYNLDYETISRIGINLAADSIDSYYGYKTEKQLLDFIKKRYGENAEIVCNATDFCITAESDDMLRNLRPDLEVVREIASRVRNIKSTIKKVVIIITNDNMGKSKYIVKIKHTLTLDIYKRWLKIEE